MMIVVLLMIASSVLSIFKSSWIDAQIKLAQRTFSFFYRNQVTHSVTDFVVYGNVFFF